MKFTMNDREWLIKEVEQSAFWEDDGQLDKMTDKEYYFGRTKFNIREIWISKELSKEQKRKTLYHELMHCYRGMYFTFATLDGQDEELWCDIVSNSHDIIHSIVEDYFTPTIEIKTNEPTIALLKGQKEPLKRR